MPSEKPATAPAAPAATDEPAGPQTAAEPPMPGNVYQAVARVMAELPGIGKDQTAAPEQGAYAYRGIEAITRHAQQLFGRYGVVFVLEEVGYMVDPITVNGKPWTDTTLTVVYHVHGPGGADDVLTVGPIHVVGRDNSDKGANKARTQAFKYALLQLLCIGDQKDDADHGSPEADKRDAPAPPPDPNDPRVPRSTLANRIRELTPEQREQVRDFTDSVGAPRIPNAWTDEQLAAVEEFVDKLVISGRAQDDTAVDGDAAAEREVQPAVEDPPRPAVSFDVAKLPAATTPEDDLRWLAASPDGLVQEVANQVKLIAADDVNAACRELDLPITGKEETKRARVAARKVRHRMETMAGLRPEPEPDVEPAPDEEPAGK